MRKFISTTFILLIVGVTAFSQKKNGTIYSEHEAIDKTRALWQAFAAGDRDKYVTFFADSVYFSNNGEESVHVAGKDAGKNINWWHTEIENVKVQDAKPAYPDALDYKEAGVWVQDWLLVTGRHKKSGINIEMPIHNLYSFNKDGKITFMASYFDNDIFEAIRNSGTKQENGEVYINHPYIITVRKLVNAYVDRDYETWKSFFNSNARFGASWAEFGKTLSLDEVSEFIKKDMADMDRKIKVEQVGYPDCIYYAKNDNYTVYSWWKITEVKNGKKYVYPFMMSHDFDDDGKIYREFIYASTNLMPND